MRVKIRIANFKTLISYVDSAMELKESWEVEGYITTLKREYIGFGHEPMFRPKGHNLKFAEVIQQKKAKISHRSIEKLIAYSI